MGTVAAISTDVEVMEPQDERELWILGREMERAPYWSADEGLNSRLGRALRVVSAAQVTPESDGSYVVLGREGHLYRVREHCSCPDHTYRKERPCYHQIAVILYIEWMRRLGKTPQGLPRAAATQADGTPVDDATLPLALPPTTAEERLAAPPTPQDGPGEEIAPMVEYGDLPASTSAPTAGLEPPAPPRLVIPAEYVKPVHGRPHVLYTGLLQAARQRGLMTLAADWTYNDAELSLAHAVAVFADGRRYEDSGDASPSNVDKAVVKSFRRVALTRAKARCLRDALGISECSIEELETDDAPGSAPRVPDFTRQPPAPTLRQQIWTHIRQQAPEVQGREETARWIKDRTGYVLEEGNFAAILHALVAE